MTAGHQDLPHGAWTRLQSAIVQIDHVKDLPSHHKHVGVYVSIGRYGHISYASWHDGNVDRIDSLVKMPVDKDTSIMSLELVDLNTHEIIGGCMIDVREACTSQRHRKKFQATVPMGAGSSAPLVKMGVKLVDERIERPITKTFADKATHVPNVTHSNLKLAHGVKYVKMAVERVPRDSQAARKPHSVDLRTRDHGHVAPAQQKKVSRRSSSSSFKQAKPRIEAQFSGEMAVMTDLNTTFYQELGQEAGFEFINKH